MDWLDRTVILPNATGGNGGTMGRRSVPCTPLCSLRSRSSRQSHRSVPLPESPASPRRSSKSERQLVQEHVAFRQSGLLLDSRGKAHARCVNHICCGPSDEQFARGAKPSPRLPGPLRRHRAQWALERARPGPNHERTYTDSGPFGATPAGIGPRAPPAEAMAGWR